MKNALDLFYTPKPLAEKLVDYVDLTDITTAIDFCVGDGDLLKAVQAKKPKIHFYGTDISEIAVNSISQENIGWTLGVCDFRDDESIDRLTFLQNTRFDLIMLNPPFTCKGSIIEHIVFDDIEFKVSTAMLFVMRSIKFLSSFGGIYAILPVSCVYSEKDKKAWMYLEKHYNACILDEPERNCFGNLCSPNIVLVYIGNRPQINYLRRTLMTTFFNLPVESVVRGRIRMQNLQYSHSSKALRLIHTTNMQEGRLVNMNRILAKNIPAVDGYGVVIPRVCYPNPNKVAILDGKYSYILSDCVILLRTATMEAAMQVRRHILDNWTAFSTIYKGTGARYTTLERVKTILGITFRGYK